MEMIRVAALMILSAAISSAQPQGKPGAPISVCDAIRKRLVLNRRMVAVRGDLHPGGHGPFLEALSGCDYRLVTRGVDWPKRVFLTFPNNQSKDETVHVDFQVDDRVIRRAEDQIQRADPSDTVVATYVGLLVTFPDLDQRVNPGVPTWPRLGFGPVGLDAPVELVIKTIEDVVVSKHFPC